MKINSFFKASLAIFLLTLFGCDDESFDGNGVIIIETRPLTSFVNVESSGTYDITIVQNSVSSITIEAESNLIPIIVTSIVGDRLIISVSENYSSDIGIKLTISSPDFNSIEMSGTGNLVSQGDITVDAFSIAISGVVDTDISGSSDIQTMVLSGVGNIRNFDLISNDVVVVISGTGNIDVTANNTLDATISGTGNISYKGNICILIYFHFY